MKIYFAAPGIESKYFLDRSAPLGSLLFSFADIFSQKGNNSRRKYIQSLLNMRESDENISGWKFSTNDKK